MNKVSVILSALFLTSACSDQLDRCLMNKDHTSFYEDVVDDSYVAVYLKNDKATLISNRESSDVSPNPATTDIYNVDGALWFVGMAIPIEDSKPVYRYNSRTCKKIKSTGSVLRFSCSYEDNTSQEYDFDHVRGLTAMRYYVDGKLVSHTKLLSNEGVFSHRC